MRTKEELSRFTVAPESGADFVATKEGGLARLTPLKPRPRAWLKANADAEATWVGETLVVELPFFPALADGIIDAGFVFERTALLN